ECSLPDSASGACILIGLSRSLHLLAVGEPAANLLVECDGDVPGRVHEKRGVARRERRQGAADEAIGVFLGRMLGDQIDRKPALFGPPPPRRATARSLMNLEKRKTLV